MPNTWIFPIEHSNYLQHLNLFKSDRVFSWILFHDEYLDLIGTGDNIYLWSLGGKNQTGIFGYARIIDKPFKYPLKRQGSYFSPNIPEDELPKWTYDEEVECVERVKYRDYTLRFRVGIRVEKLANDNELVDEALFLNDPALSELKIIHNWRTQFLLTDIQIEKLKILCQNTGLIPAKNINDPTSISGQGYLEDPVVKKAIEIHAVTIAKTHYLETGFVVTDTGKSESYDLSCFKNGVERRVEVKGTTTKGASVILTRPEVEHVRCKKTPVDFVLVSEIVVTNTSKGVQTSGGNLRIIENWMPADQDLIIKTYDYKIPSDTIGKTNSLPEIVKDEI